MEKLLREKITEKVTELWGVTDLNFTVEHPAEVAHGDFACNVALVLAGKVGQAPREVAEQLRAALADQIPAISKIEIAGPGFINFFLDQTFFQQTLENILNDKAAWGRNDALSGQEILIEYTSPNLFKPVHIGNLVGNIIGEAMSRLLEFGGATVRRINYPSDIGLTVAKGVWGLRTSGLNPDDVLALGQAYRQGNEAYENNETAKAEIDEINKKLYQGADEELNLLRMRGIKTSLASLAEICRMVGTKFDFELTESSVSEVGIKTVKENIGRVFTESQGAVVFEGEKVGLHTRVFLNSQGLPTYEAKDVGNFIFKTNQYPDWSRSIIVTGNEQREYFKVLFAALHEIFPEIKDGSLEHIPTGFLTLTTGKMSSRKGNVLTVDSSLGDLQAVAREKAENARTDNVEELSEMVAVAALKYQVLRQSLGSSIVFDQERAMSFEGDSGPYLQYTYARLGSVIAKAESLGIKASTEKDPAKRYEVEALLYRFPEIIKEACDERSPHKVIGYLMELASNFNSFYATEKIADTTDEFAPYKLALVQAVQATIKNGLWTLGIKAPERM